MICMESKGIHAIYKFGCDSLEVRLGFYASRAITTKLTHITAFLVVPPVALSVINFRDRLTWAKTLDLIAFQKLQEVIYEDHEGLEAKPNLTRKSIYYGVKNRDTTKSIFDIEAAAGMSDDESNDNRSSSHSPKHATTVVTTSSINEEEFLSAWFRQSARYTLLLVMTGVFVPYVALCLGFNLSLSYLNAGCIGCREEALVIGLSTLASFIWFYVLIINAWRIRHVPDPLGILEELKLGCMFSLIIASPGILLLILDDSIGNLYDRGVFSPDWLIVLSVMSLHFFQCGLQVIKALNMIRLTSSWVRAQTADLKSLLSDPVGQKLFAAHLVAEWSVENLKFWLQTESFRKHFEEFKTAKDANLMAKQIYSTFVKSGAVMEVNIPWEMKLSLKNYFEKHEVAPSAVAAVMTTAVVSMATPGETTTLPRLDTGNLNPAAVSSTIFDEANMEVFLLMQKDSFRRFTTTIAFKNWAQSALTVPLPITPGNTASVRTPKTQPSASSLKTPTSR